MHRTHARTLVVALGGCEHGPTMHGNVRVLTVDDHVPFLRVAREVIEATPGFEPAREVRSGAEALDLAEALDPDLTLIDVHMPGMSGIEVARRLKEARPARLIVLISSTDPGELPPSVRTCGADAVVRKQDLGPALLRRLVAADAVGEDP
jgi:two-component system, NarL family, invasion response regulator UvrY